MVLCHGGSKINIQNYIVNRKYFKSPKSKVIVRVGFGQFPLSFVFSHNLSCKCGTTFCSGKDHWAFLLESIVMSEMKLSIRISDVLYKMQDLAPIVSN